MCYCLLSCSSDKETSVLPQPNITAKISGFIDLDYQGSGFVTQGDLYHSLAINIASTGKFFGKSYSLGIYLINKDFKEKTGAFVLSDKDLPTDYAVGVFEITENRMKKSFLADSGSVIITQLIGNSIIGTFNFRAIARNSNDTIWATQGTIYF